MTISQRLACSRRFAFLLAVSVMVAACTSPSGPSAGSTTFLVPRVDTAVPAFASSIVATPIMIRGDGFAPGATVSFGGEAVSATVNNRWQLTVLAPPRPPGPATVVVRNPNGRTGEFTGAFRFEAVEPLAVRMRGKVVAGEAEVPVAGATVDLPQVVAMTPIPSGMTDDDGRFELEGTLPLGSQYVAVRLVRPGIGQWTSHLSLTESEPVIRLDLMLIRPGVTVRGDLHIDNALWCTFESIACHRLVVDGPAGSAIDVEIVPESGQPVGLILDEGFRAPTEFPTRVRVTPRVMWVMGGFGRYTITAK